MHTIKKRVKRLYSVSLFMSLDDTGTEFLIKTSNQGTSNGVTILDLCGLIGQHLFSLLVELYINTFRNAP